MFVQIIEGTTTDPEGLKRQGERWLAELRPGADGFLGATAGVTPDGRAITIARFESEDAARRNSDRPEQGAWWTETEKFYDGDVSFTESSDVSEMLGGPRTDAGFVQVMKSTDVDRAQMTEMDGQFEKFADQRPDLIGTFRVWTGPSACTEVAYFTSEAEARAGEQAELPDELQDLMADFGEMMQNTEFLDLADPQLF
jgi:hypothetical protein